MDFDTFLVCRLCTGADLACGYYTCWFLEEELRRSLGEAAFSRGYPDADGQIKRLLEILKNLLPVEKKLQKAQGSKVWSATEDTQESGTAPAVADAEALAAARAALDSALENRDSADIPGIDMAFPLETYAGNLEEWAKDVETILTPEHRADCARVRARVENPGCSSCMQTSCRKCYWPKTVRYWRRVETGGRFAEVEGYSKHMKAPTEFEID